MLLTPSREIQIVSRKLSGAGEKRWGAQLLDSTLDFLIAAGRFERSVTHRYLGQINAGAPCLEFFSKHEPFAIFVFYSEDYLSRRFYCNLNTIPRLNNDRIEFLDLEVDVWIDLRRNLQVLDMEDFKRARHALVHHIEASAQVRRGLKALLKLYFTRQFPFDNFSLDDFFRRVNTP